MLQNALVRPVIGLPLAGLVVFALFAFMQSMIAVDYVPPQPAQERDLTALTPKLPEKPEVGERPRPQPLPIAHRPSPPPKYAATQGDIDLPGVSLSGAVPARVDVNILRYLHIAPVAIGNRDIQPISPPVVNYPQSLANRNIQGDCEVRFDVDTRGRPHNLIANCSHPSFEREAMRAVSRVKFAPMVQRGQAVERKNVVYPIEFRL